MKKKNLKNTKLKKKEIKQIPKAIVNIFASFNNTIMTLADTNGNVIITTSTGALGFKGTKKPTPFAASSVASKIIDKAREVNVSEVDIRVKGVGPGRDSAMRAFASSGITVNLIKDVTPIPHGGVRPKKPRRV